MRQPALAPLHPSEPSQAFCDAGLRTPNLKSKAVVVGLAIKMKIEINNRKVSKVFSPTGTSSP